MTLIRKAIRIFYRRSQKERLVQGFSQSNSGCNIAFQMGNHGSARSNSAVWQGNISAYRQGHSNYPIQVGQSGRTVEVNNWEWYRGKGNLAVSNLNSAEFRTSHPFPLRLKARFGRSFRAFVNAWRQA
jgi:hypothetical protein